jgi:hypothetical protein
MFVPNRPRTFLKSDSSALSNAAWSCSGTASPASRIVRTFTPTSTAFSRPFLSSMLEVASV